MKVIVKIEPGGEGLPLPAYARPGDAGLDLRSRQSGSLLPGESVAVPTGVSFEIPDGFEGQVRPRSGLAVRAGVTVLNSPGTIDSGYRGEVMVILINHGSRPWLFERGERIAQIVFSPVVRVVLEQAGALTESARGVSGLGSTGVR